MEELQLTLTPARVDQRNFGVMLSNWRVGQVINALVVDRMPSGNVLLNAGGREFVTPLDLPVQPGTRLQLEVQQVTPQLCYDFWQGQRRAACYLARSHYPDQPNQVADSPVPRHSVAASLRLTCSPR